MYHDRHVHSPRRSSSKHTGPAEPEPETYRVRFADAHVVTKVEFDWESEAWNGSVETLPVESSAPTKMD
jgi:hypothetical protein